MTGYDASKDRVLCHVGNVSMGEKARLEVTIVSYDGGPPKVSSMKVGAKWSTANIGRLTARQTEEYVAMLVRAVAMLNAAALVTRAA